MTLSQPGVFLLWIGLAGPNLGPVGLVGGICSMAVFMDAGECLWGQSLIPRGLSQLNGSTQSVLFLFRSKRRGLLARPSRQPTDQWDHERLSWWIGEPVGTRK